MLLNIYLLHNETWRSHILFRWCEFNNPSLHGTCTFVYHLCKQCTCISSMKNEQLKTNENSCIKMERWRFHLFGQNAMIKVEKKTLSRLFSFTKMPSWKRRNTGHIKSWCHNVYFCQTSKTTTGSQVLISGDWCLSFVTGERTSLSYRRPQ